MTTSAIHQLKVCLYFLFRHCFWTSLRCLGWPVLLDFLSLVIFFLLHPLVDAFLEGLPSQGSFQKHMQTIFFRNNITGWLASSSIPHTSFPFFQEAIYRRREETLTTVSQFLPTKGEEEIGGEVIPRKSYSLACLIFQ